MDPIIGSLVPTHPAFTFRRARSLRNELISSEYKGGSKDPCKRFGAFKCGGCRYCQFMDVGTHKLLPNNNKFVPGHFSNCKTVGVVYLLQCDCQCFYVGKTKNELWRRIYHHIQSMKVCNPDLPLGRHTIQSSKSILPEVRFLVLDRIHSGIRGGHWNKILLQCEQRWIFKLGATRFPWLNDMVSFKPFLEGFQVAWKHNIFPPPYYLHYLNAQCKLTFSS